LEDRRWVVLGYYAASPGGAHAHRPIASVLAGVLDGGLRPGARILAISAKNPVLSVRTEAGGAEFRFTVNYTAAFAAAELNETYLDCIELFEHDVSSADDPLTDGCVDADDFVATQQEVSRAKEVTLSDRQASTELGAEEIYAIVRLSGSTTGGLDSTRTTVVKVDT
jgi:hypothetical protein